MTWTAAIILAAAIVLFWLSTCLWKFLSGQGENRDDWGGDDYYD